MKKEMLKMILKATVAVVALATVTACVHWPQWSMLKRIEKLERTVRLLEYEATNMPPDSVIVRKESFVNP